jgi:hypothetical protein
MLAGETTTPRSDVTCDRPLHLFSRACSYLLTGSHNSTLHPSLLLYIYGSPRSNEPVRGLDTPEPRVDADCEAAGVTVWKGSSDAAMAVTMAGLFCLQGRRL